MIGLQVLRRSPGHNPNQLFAVWFVTFTGAVLGHAPGHEVPPVEQLAVADLQRNRETSERYAKEWTENAVTAVSAAACIHVSTQSLAIQLHHYIMQYSLI